MTHTTSTEPMTVDELAVAVADIVPILPDGWTGPEILQRVAGRPVAARFTNGDRGYFLVWFETIPHCAGWAVGDANQNVYRLPDPVTAARAATIGPLMQPAS